MKKKFWNVTIAGLYLLIPFIIFEEKLDFFEQKQPMSQTLYSTKNQPGTSYFVLRIPEDWPNTITNDKKLKNNLKNSIDMKIYVTIIYQQQ